jgi:hypothetical protein
VRWLTGSQSFLGGAIERAHCRVRRDRIPPCLQTRICDIVAKRLGSLYVSGRSRHWIKSRLRPRRPSNEKQRKIGGGEPMLLILQEMIFAVLFAVSAVEAADVLVRLLTALGWQ